MDSPVVQEDCQEHNKWIKMQEVHSVMASMPSYKNILFSDGKTKLLDCISSMEKPNTLQKFLQDMVNINASLPCDSPLWPGSTPLHLAVMFSENRNNGAALVRQFLDRGASIHVKNHRGATPLHLAFRLDQRLMVALLLFRQLKKKSQVANLLDDENLSYLHIACAIGDAKMLLDTINFEGSVNVAYKGEALASVRTGWTPLHVAVDQHRVTLVEALLKRGADPVCTDAQGYTAVHRLFGTTDTTATKPIADLLFASKLLTNRTVESVNLTHLHVAVWFDDAKSVKRLLHLGADIEGPLGAVEPKKLEKFAGCTPLFMAMILDHRRTAKTLLQRGADVLARNHDGSSPLSKTLTNSPHVPTGSARAIVDLILSDNELLGRLEEELGLTKLHIACYSCEVNEVEAMLRRGADANARLHDDSDFWMGYTPLHALIASEKSFWVNGLTAIFRKLLENGCDIDRQDSTGKTAYHLALAVKNWHDDGRTTSEFLSAGTDINIVDRNGKSAISYALDIYSRCQNRWHTQQTDEVVRALMWHVSKMRCLGIEVSELNETLATIALRKHNVTPDVASQGVFINQLRATERVNIGQRGLSLRSFLCETSAVSLYPSLTPTDRNELADFFQSFNDQNFNEVTALLKLQYRKAVARLALIEPARGALKSFICSGFPDLCVDIILKYLSNSQLKPLIEASIDDKDV